MNAATILLAAFVASAAASLNTDLSCQGQCGGYTQDGSDYCYCDAYCTYNGDCCGDATTLCLTPPSPSSGPAASCTGYCGNYNDAAGCYCDSICSYNPFGDCCTDYSSVCASSSPSSPPSGSCEGNCGGCDSSDYYYDYGSCCCDSLCTFLGDCCSDKDQYCTQSPGASGSCDGFCGEYWGSYQQCHCDTVCTEYGDCCSDYDDECGAADENSCVDHCGEAYVGNCHCDAISTLYQDGCADYAQACGSSAPPAPCGGSDQGSCVGYCSYSPPDYSCYCDNYCTVAGDCCCDAETACSITKPTPGSCTGICGQNNQKADGTYCYCDTYCTYNGDCCDDYSTYCGNNPPPPPDQAASCVTSNLCGSYNSAYSCGCDDACTYFGDCCDSYSDCTTTKPLHGDTKDDPIVIDSLPYDFEGSTTDYTDTADVPIECQTDYDYESTGVDVWFQYTPTSKVSVNISLCGEGTNFDSYVYLEEASDTGLIGKACNDDSDRGGCGLSSEITAELDAGTTYYIVIDGYSKTDKGDFHLQIDAKMGNTIQDAIPVGSLPFDYEGDTDGYDDSYTPPETCASSSTASDVVFKLTLGYSSTVTLSLCGSGFDNLMYIMNNTGVVLDGKCNDDSNRDGCTSDAFLTLDVQPNVDYYVVVDGYAQSKGEFRLQIDELKGNTEADAISVGYTLPYEDEGDTSKHTNNFNGAIAQGCEKESTAPDVFYKVYYYSTYDVTIDICSDDFDTVLYVYQSGDEGNPQVKKCNDEADRDGCNKASSVSLTIQQYEYYYIVVDGIGNGSGKYRLTIKENNGDTLTNPISIPSLPFVYDGTTGVFTHSYDLPSNCVGSKSNGPDVWFQYYSPTDQTLNVTTCGSATDTVVSLLSKSSSPSVIQCNDDGTHQECSTASELTVDVDSSTYYYILVSFVGGNNDTNYRLEINSSLRP